MQMNAEELKAIRRAQIDVMIWPYARWLVLAGGVAGLVLIFWIISSASLEVLASPQFNFARAGATGFIAVLLVFPLANWRNRKSRLLLKLASANRDDAA